MRNLYYYNPKTIDIAKLRADATRHATGDHRAEPEEVVIHHHAAEGPCEGKEHEKFTPSPYDSTIPGAVRDGNPSVLVYQEPSKKL